MDGEQFRQNNRSRPVTRRWEHGLSRSGRSPGSSMLFYAKAEVPQLLQRLTRVCTCYKRFTQLMPAWQITHRNASYSKSVNSYCSCDPIAEGNAIVLDHLLALGGNTAKSMKASGRGEVAPSNRLCF